MRQVIRRATRTHGACKACRQAASIGAGALVALIPACIERGAGRGAHRITGVGGRDIYARGARGCRATRVGTDVVRSAGTRITSVVRRIERGSRRTGVARIPSGVVKADRAHRPARVRGCAVDAAVAAGAGQGSRIVRTARAVVRAVRISQCLPGNAAGAAQSDASRLIQAAARRVVTDAAVGGDATRFPERIGRAVQEVTVLIDTQAEIAAVQAVVRRIGVGAGIPEAAAVGADSGVLSEIDAAVHQEETDAVRTVTAATAGVATISHRLEGDLNALPGREGARRDDCAALIAATRRTVRKAQRAVTR